MDGSFSIMIQLIFSVFCAKKAAFRSMILARRKSRKRKRYRKKA